MQFPRTEAKANKKLPSLHKDESSYLYELAWCHLSSLQPFTNAALPAPLHICLHSLKMLQPHSRDIGRNRTGCNPCLLQSGIQSSTGRFALPTVSLYSLGFTFLFHKVAFCFYKSDYMRFAAKSQYRSFVKNDTIFQDFQVKTKK